MRQATTAEAHAQARACARQAGVSVVDQEDEEEDGQQEEPRGTWPVAGRSQNDLVDAENTMQSKLPDSVNLEQR